MKNVRLPPLLAAAAAVAVATWILGGSSVAASEQVSDTRYVGAEHCGGCHPYAYKVWQASAHARALGALGDAERQDPKCLLCHDPTSGEGVSGVTGVQCESCHGAGRYYSPSHVMRDHELRELLGFKQPDAKTCQACHTESTPSMRPFKYDEKIELIRHAEPEAAAPAGP